MITRNATTLFIFTLCHSLTNAGELIDETREVSMDALVNIEIFNGEVTITGHDDAVFHIKGELSEAAEGFELRNTNGNIRFEETIERGSRWDWRNYRNNNVETAQLEIRLPRGSILRFEGTNTQVDVSNLTGNTEIEVVNGAIVAANLAGVTRLDTVNGSIDTRNISGRMVLDTVNGSIEDRDSHGSKVSLSAVNGSIRSNNRSPQVFANNVNGTIELELGAIDDVEVSTVGGSVELSATMNELAHIDLSSVNGSIDLALPTTTSASFHITTAVGGRIRNDLSTAEAERVNRYVNSRELNFVLNGGNGDVNISTVSGNINLRECSGADC